MSSEESSYASGSSDGNSPAMTDLYQITNPHSSTNSDKTRIDNLTYYYPNSNVDAFPSSLNPNECNNAIILSQGNTVATCKSSAKSDAFSVSSDKSVPNCCSIYYYEATVLCDGVDGHIAVGFGPADSHTLLPGWSAKSIGYHADDGFVFISSHKRYGSGYKCGDVVGCGINFITNKFFFTQNGLFYGYYPDTFLTRDSAPFYAVAGMQSIRESVSMNFGQERFVFDLKAMIKREQATLMKSVLQRSPVHINVICRMVVEYLVYNGYYKTAVAFGNLVSLDVEFDASLFRFSQELKDLITSGDMVSAIYKCKERFPDIFQQHPAVYFRMKVQHFVELIMFHHREFCPPNNVTTFVDSQCNIHQNRLAEPIGAGDIEMDISGDTYGGSLNEEWAVNLILFARDLHELCKNLFSAGSTEYKSNENLLLQAVSLMEFDNPWTSPFGQSLMTPSPRIDIFSSLNSIILESFGSQKIPSIEIARNQLNKCIELMRKLKVPESFIIPML